MLVAAVSLLLLAQTPFSLPPDFGKNLGSAAQKPATFGPTITVVVDKVPVPASVPAPAPQALELGLKLYRQRCVLCHGDSGRADGVGARRIHPEPQRLNDVIWQANATDDEIARAIVDGGAAVSRSPMMPANPDLKTKPNEVKALVAYVRSLRAKHGSVVGSMALADKSSVAVHADADATGSAKLVFADVKKGPAVITVLIDAQGKIGCTLNVVADKDVTLPCK